MRVFKRSYTRPLPANARSRAPTAMDVRYVEYKGRGGRSKKHLLTQDGKQHARQVGLLACRSSKTIGGFVDGCMGFTDRAMRPTDWRPISSG